MATPEKSQTEVRKRVIPKSRTICGLTVPYLFIPSIYESGVKYVPDPSDVFLVTFPKCGTTWMQLIILQIYNKGNASADFMSFMAASPFLEMVGAEAVQKMRRPGAIKTHLPFNLTPYSPKVKYIYIARNPKDCLVSFYYHTKSNIGSEFEEGTFDDFFELFVTGQNDYGDYFDHLLSWYPHKDDPNVLFLTYEQMKADIRSVILRLAEFLGQEWHEMLQKEPEILDKIIEMTNFESVKKIINTGIVDFFKNAKPEELLNNPDIPEVMKDIMKHIASKTMRGESLPSQFELARKGTVGDWRNHFSPEQNKRMNERIREKTKGSDVMDLWKDIDIGLD